MKKSTACFKSLTKLEAALSGILYKLFFLYEAGILSSILPAEQGAMLQQELLGVHAC